jgi:Ca2+-transporting ATPase
VTITLALGAQRMLKRQALIRKLPAVETLGSVTVICSDKTGTLTENRMTVTVLDVAGHRVDLVEPLQGPAPALSSSDAVPDALEAQPALALLAAAGALCNDAQLRDGNGGGKFHTIGDPTEGAMVVAGARLGMWKHELDAAFPRVAEVPFDSDRKRMLTVHALPQSAATLPVPLRSAWQLGACLAAAPYAAFAKGAVDSLLGISTHVWLGDRAEALDESWRARIVAAHDGLAQDGMRVLGVAFRALDAPPDGNLDLLERDLIFVGMVGMIDPPRPEVQAAVKTAQSAGIRPVMITGDHPLTARHIARVLGIDAGNRVLTGQDLARMSVEELERAVADVSVFARVSPEHKLSLIEVYQEQDNVVAMTGDGVNDAPALKKADIGVAMGITGTDVAKEAAKMVLLDDNFATIVAAVEEGRVVYDNIRKFIKYLLSCNASEIGVVLLWPLAAWLVGVELGSEAGIALLPLQILWINLVTDGLPALALGVEGAEKNVMRRPPRSSQESIFGRGMATFIIVFGILMSLVTIGIGLWARSSGDEAWQTLLFTTLIFNQIMLAVGVRSEERSLPSIGFFSNMSMVWAFLSTALLQLIVIYVPFLQRIFGTRPLPAMDVLVALASGLTVLMGVEFWKFFARRRNPVAPR